MSGWMEISILVRQRDWLLRQLAKLLGVGAIAWLLAAVWRRRRRARPLDRIAASDQETPLAPELVELLSGLDRVWQRRGLPRPLSRAPLEHLGALPANKISPEFRQACQDAVEYFYSCCFGGSPLEPGRARELRRNLEAGG